MRRSKICGFTLVELLVVILIISVLATFLVPAVFNVRKKVYRSQCMNRLRSIGQMSIMYADENKVGFPVATGEEPKAYESLQLLVNAMKDARDPEMYVCPSSNTLPLEGWNEESSEPFTLTEETVSFAWRNKKLRATGTGGSKTALGCDNAISFPDQGIEGNHEDGVNMLYIDGAIKFLTLADLKPMKGFENSDMTEFLAAKTLGR